MSARVLVVDDVLPNVKVLEAKLTAEYFDVLTAFNGRDALETIYNEHPDIVLLDVMMPIMDGFEVCQKIKADPAIAHIPVVMVTALSGQQDRVRGLEAGADDFLTKPVDDVALFARVRSLVRLKMMMDELRLREETGQDFGVIDSTAASDGSEVRGRVLVIEDYEISAEAIRETLGDQHDIQIEPDCAHALERATTESFDLVIVSMAVENYDPLRFCSQIRSTEETRQLPILTLVDEGDSARLIKGLELGVSDYLMRPLERHELTARTRTQIRRKHYQDRLRSNYQRSMAMAVTDSLTGLFNRRYLNNHLENLLSHREDEGKPLSMLILDIDHFKRINDTHGHGVGDEVLKQFAQRMGLNLRGVDLAARIGGEEFVVVMPSTDLALAEGIAERLRRAVGDEPFKVNGTDQPLEVTCSIGVITARSGESPKEALARADAALYEAKHRGRNKVVKRIA
ncbi:PleD family two-component system response regulator [Oceanibacterium hippocampi]|uniref:diguanylate cyclase n=1 Tax=Oceanibacterium hippocampi TaxID=745714 RepID=A0A1Y5SM66_9PROT|nr:PleD family two-component system response regulator [Oceanibacterium hippocampi]SLN43906.1 Response regulator PleD [Oceanibacterium hippocampi]